MTVGTAGLGKQKITVTVKEKVMRLIMAALAWAVLLTVGWMIIHYEIIPMVSYFIGVVVGGGVYLIAAFFD